MDRIKQIQRRVCVRVRNTVYIYLKKNILCNKYDFVRSGVRTKYVIIYLSHIYIHSSYNIQIIII